MLLPRTSGHITVPILSLTKGFASESAEMQRTLTTKQASNRRRGYSFSPLLRSFAWYQITGTRFGCFQRRRSCSSRILRLPLACASWPLCVAGTLPSQITEKKVHSLQSHHSSLPPATMSSRQATLVATHH